MAAVRRYAVLDTPPDGAFDRIAALAARLTGAPVAIVSIDDTDGTWFDSHHGLGGGRHDQDPGSCTSAVLPSELRLLDDDVVLDLRAVTNPVVAEKLGFPFYAGVPLTADDGRNLGTLCVIDQRPRRITQAQIDILSDLAALVTNELELRRAARMTAKLHAALTQSGDRRFRTAFESSPVGMALLDVQSRFLMVNPALCRLLGRTETDLLEMTMSQVCHPEAVDTDVAAMARVFSGETASLQTETRWLRFDGDVVGVLINVLPVPEPQASPGYFLCQVQDITRTRRGERRTRYLAELRRKALAGMTVDTLMEEAVGAVTTSLNLDCAMLHTPSTSGDLCLATAVGCPGEGSSSGGRGEGGRSQARYTLERGEAVVVADLGNETRFVPPPQLLEQGLVSGVSVVVTVRGRGHGVLAAYSARAQRFSASDVDFVQAVADLLGRAIERRDHDEAQERLHQQERLAAVGQLAAGVAHDFNNIVSAVSLYTELLEGRQLFDDAGREHLGAIRQQVERATTLIWQILDFAHRSPLQLVAVDLSSFLAELGPILRRTMPEDVDITVVHDGGPYVVQGDPTRLQQIFLNLATNARDAFVGPGQLTITLSLAETPPDFDPLDGPDDRTWVRVDVADTGRGMLPGVLARVFEPFFTTKPLAGGTGLGLSQVHGLVSQHGGHVSIDSSDERGTTVSIWLPRVDAVTTTPETISAQIPRARGERLAVVDDNPAVRTALGQVLESLGYVVELAGDGEEALTMLEREPSALSGVVSDVIMPGIGGEELARVVTERWPDLPVVLVSGYPVPALHGHPGAGTARTVDRHAGRVIRLAKPFTLNQLAETLRAALD